MSSRKLLIIGASLLALAACGEKKSDQNKAEVPAVEEVAREVIDVVKLSPEDAMKRAEEYLAENAKAEGVQVTESGLQYKSVKEGEGAAPSEEDFVTVHYVGTLVDGKVFDSSVARDEPVTFPLSAVIPGWKEGILLMKQGGKAQFVLPSSIAYGERGTPDGTIGPNEAIRFEVELLEVIAKDNTARLQEIQNEARARFASKQEALGAVNAAAAVEYLKNNASKNGVQATESGLQYVVLERGAGDMSPVATDEVEVHYRGTLINGTEFDSSYSRGATATFPLGGVIKGWTEGVQLMNEGDKFRFFIPPELAYGATPRPGGPIGPNELLIFDIELVDVKDAPVEAGE